jgi:hypothetical protein
MSTTLNSSTQKPDEPKKAYISPESLLYLKTYLRPSHIRPIRPIRPTPRRSLISSSSYLPQDIPHAVIPVFQPFCFFKKQNYMLCNSVDDALTSSTFRREVV